MERSWNTNRRGNFCPHPFFFFSNFAKWVYTSVDWSQAHSLNMRTMIELYSMRFSVVAQLTGRVVLIEKREFQLANFDLFQVLWLQSFIFSLIWPFHVSAYSTRANEWSSHASLWRFLSSMLCVIEEAREVPVVGDDGVRIHAMWKGSCRFLTKLHIQVHSEIQFT